MDEKQKLVELGAESLASIIIEAREKIEERRISCSTQSLWPI